MTEVGMWCPALPEQCADAQEGLATLEPDSWIRTPLRQDEV